MFTTGIPKSESLARLPKCKQDIAQNRRTIKSLVELTIGIIGLIGIMLAQIASSDKTNHHSKLHPASAISEMGSDFSEKVESISKVSPMASKISFSNIIF
ncbi:MAG: hypothetical protein KUG78_10020 [Kangiellaceae bacterium]|nr:hypothetical protein [Kangiellaceae bacterium]